MTVNLGYPLMHINEVSMYSWEGPLEEEMATHSYFCLENPMDRGACWTTVHEVTEGQTRLSG